MHRHDANESFYNAGYRDHKLENFRTSVSEKLSETLLFAKLYSRTVLSLETVWFLLHISLQMHGDRLDAYAIRAKHWHFRRHNGHMA